MAHQVSLSQPQDSTFLVSPSLVTPSFTPEQYQKLLALIGTPSSPLASLVQGKDTLATTMANVVSFNGSVMAGMNLTHSVFSAQVVNRKAYDSTAWVIDTSATDHIVCSVHLLTTVTANTMSIVQLPNGETALVTHVGTVTLSSSLILHNVLYVPSFA